MADQDPASDLSVMAHVRAPKQQRARQTLDRILRSCVEVILESGTEGMTVAEVVRRARASVGSFYARFGSKEDLLCHLEESLWTEIGEHWSLGAPALAEAVSVEAWVQGAATLLAQTMQGRYPVLRILVVRHGEGHTSPGAMRLRGMVRAEAEAVLSMNAGADGLEPEGAADGLASLVIGVAKQFCLRSGGDLGESTELIRATFSSLASPSIEGTKAEIDFFDVWE